MNLNRFRIKSFLTILAVAISTIPGRAFSQDIELQKGFLWEVQSKTTTVYLLGSIHVGDESLYPLAETIMDAYDQSDLLAVEVNALNIDQKKLQQFTLEHGLYRDGRTLKDSLSPGLYKRFNSELTKLGLKTETFLLMKPWLAALSFAGLKVQGAKLDPGYGIDAYFLGQANGNKEIIELESASFQLEIFSSWTDRQQALFLEYTLEDPGSSDLLKQMIPAWKKGDGEFLEKSIIGPMKDDPKMKEIYESLFTNRNVTMTKKIEGFLTGSKSHFVVVGAGHLIGSDGIVQMLDSETYQIQRL